MALGVYISPEITSFAGLTLEKYFIRKLIESIGRRSEKAKEEFQTRRLQPQNRNPQV